MAIFSLPIQVSSPVLSTFSTYQACNINGYSCYSNLVSMYIPDLSNPNLIFMPTGITDYGIAVQNGNIYQYSYTTNEVVGFVYLNSLHVQPNNQCSSLTYSDAASAQLNGVIVINAKDGTTYYLWAQNTVDINNDLVYYRPVDNIWELDNYTTILDNNLLSGQGSIYSYSIYFFNISFYAYYIHRHPLVYPFIIYLIMNITMNNNYPVIQFGYSTDGNNIIWYDNVTVDVPSTSAYFQVAPQLTPIGSPEDLELVIGGLGGGDCVYANQVSGYLALLYNNNGVLTPVPYVFNYGLSTAETITNVYPSLVSSTEVSLGIGHFYPSYLGNTQPSTYSITIYNPITKKYDIEQYPIILYKTYSFPSIVNIPDGYYQLDGIYINHILQPGSSISLLINQSYIIEPDYILYYYANLTLPGGEYYVNGRQYIGRSTITVENGTTLTIGLDKYYYYNELRYECPQQIYIPISGPENIQLLNYCIPEYYVQINSTFPINITIGNTTITNVMSYSDYIPKTTLTIYLNKYYYYNSLRYECPEQINVTVSSPESIQLLNYCIPEYYVQINSKLPINITIGNTTITDVMSYSDYVPVNQTIYIPKSVIIKNYFFYYDIYTIDPENITVNQSIQISLYPTKIRKLNYITITGTASGILVSIPTSIILIKKRKKKSTK